MPQHRALPGHEAPPPQSIPRRPQLREEDECPICHLALPPKGPDNSELAREAHVQSCVEIHFSSSVPRGSGPSPSVAPGAAIAANAATRAQAAGGRAIPISHQASVNHSGMPSASLSQSRRVAGMLVYHASEKDCVGEDGQGTQECVICFEEFAIGDEMGRLECLCKFHKVWQPESSTDLDILPGSKRANGPCLGLHKAVVGEEGAWSVPGASGRYMNP